MKLTYIPQISETERDINEQIFQEDDCETKIDCQEVSNTVSLLMK